MTAGWVGRTTLQKLRPAARQGDAAAATFPTHAADSLANPRGMALALSQDMIRLEQIRSEVLERFERVDRRFAASDQRLARIDQRTQELNDRIEILLAALTEARSEIKTLTGGSSLPRSSC
jgi:chromosome segregation ATPase